MMRRRVSIALCILGLTLGGCTAAVRKPDTVSGAQATLPLRSIVLTGPAGQHLPLQVEVASTPTQRERGLMFRSEVTRGMLFTFERPQLLYFWMKNTLVRLDILYFDADGSFINTRTMEPCTEDPCPSYPSSSPAQYGLEMPAGYVSSSGIGVGWKLGVSE